MHILIVNNTAVPVKDYGGTERVIWWLGKELVSRNHKVTYLVREGSHCPFADVRVWDRTRPLSDQVPESADVVHMHFQPGEKLNKPYIVTHHGNYHPEKEFDINTVFVSRNHAERNGSRAYVYNGLDIDEYGPVDFSRERKYLMFVGYAKRPEKNLKGCRRIARAARMPLAVIGGKFRWWRWRPGVRYHGMLGTEARNAVMREGAGLLFPVLWHEPFGLAVAESLYFGAPVFGSPYGALPELVNDEVGKLSDSRSELVRAVKNIGDYSRKRCHEWVCEHFTSKHMTDNYLQLYEKALNGQPINPAPPVNGGNFDRQNLLPMNA